MTKQVMGEAQQQSDVCLLWKRVLWQDRMLAGVDCSVDNSLAVLVMESSVPALSGQLPLLFCSTPVNVADEACAYVCPLSMVA